MTDQGEDHVPTTPAARRYLIEVSMPMEGLRDLSWIRVSLHSACRRVGGAGSTTRLVSAVFSPDDGRLACIVEAASRIDVRNVLEIALLPPARIQEVLHVESPEPSDDF